MALLMAFVLLAALGGGVWYGFDRIRGLFAAPDYTTAGGAQVTIEVKSNDTATDIANTLVKADVVKSTGAFIDAARDNPLSKNIQPGFYQLKRQMRASEALTALLDRKNKVSSKVTIPEGRTARQTYLLLEKATKIPSKDFAAAAKDPVALGVPDFWFVRSDKKKVTPSIEGFLYPDTYEFNPGTTAEEILQTMVQRFLAVAEEIEFVKTVEADRGGISPYDALIVASLAQAEAGVPKDLGKVARVAYNRLYKDFPCGCLEMDVTVNYWFDVQGKPSKPSKDMTDSELNDPRNPYNRKLRGLIPTPIDNPGRQALEGAMSPPPGDWLFFVAIDKQGNSAFANTAAEHERNKDVARQNGVI